MNKKRQWIVLAVAVIAGALLIWGKSQLQYVTLSFLILHRLAPGESAMRETVDQAPDPLAALQELWYTDRIVQQRFVGDFMRARSILAEDELWPQTRTLALLCRASSAMGARSAEPRIGRPLPWSARPCRR